MLSAVALDQLTFFVRNIFVNVSQNERFKGFVLRRQTNQFIHIIPMSSEQAAYRVTKLFRDPCPIATSESFK